MPNSSSEQLRKSGKNFTKFTPDCVSMSTGHFSTMTEMLAFWKYEGNLSSSRRFSYIMDDKSHENDETVEKVSSVVELAVGLNCEYLMLRGLKKPERYSKI